MELQLALVCDDAQTNAEGKLDVHGVFNDLYAPGFPAKQHRMVLVLTMEWNRSDEGTIQFRVELTDATGQPTLAVEGHTEVDRRAPGRPPARTQLILPLEEVIFPAPGRYTFRLKVKGRKFQGPSLHLVDVSEPPEGAVPVRIEEPGDEG
jgi:hypothetical protein